MSGNGLRHHAGTFSKLHSSHPLYQDYLASALSHTLHIHELHYETPTSIIQKLIVCPVLHRMTQPVNEHQGSVAQRENTGNTKPQEDLTQKVMDIAPDEVITHENTETDFLSDVNDASSSHSEEYCTPKKKLKILRPRWTEDDKKIIYIKFGNTTLEQNYHYTGKQSNYSTATERYLELGKLTRQYLSCIIS